MEREYDYTWYNNWMLDHESKRVKPRTATDPDSNVVYEGDKLLEVLKNSLKNKNNEEFIKAIDLLHSGVVWNDNLENQVIILKQIFRRYGFSKELSDQIEIVKSYFVLIIKQKLEHFFLFISQIFSLFLTKNIFIINFF